jgi:membrane protein YqaA with SNARE-associated domain
MRKEGSRIFERLFSPRVSVIVSFLWGFAEATLFFIIPDVFLGAVALFSPMRGILCCIMSVLGAMLGGGIMYLLSCRIPQVMLDLLAKVPGISDSMIAQVGTDYRIYGLKAIFIAPWAGVPYKIYAVQAGIHGIDRTAFILATIPARLERFILVLLVTVLLGYRFKRSILRRPGYWMTAYAVFWIACYTAYAIYLNGRI